MDDMEVAPPYPRELELRYPKVSTTNPTIEFNILDMATMNVSNIPITAFPPNDTVIGEVSWVTEDHTSVVYRIFNRVQDQDKHVVVDPAAGTSKVVRERDGTDGWLDNTVAISYVGELNGTERYVDVSDESGWNHIYLHQVSGGEPVALTSGDWEVRAILKVDSVRQLVYYTSTEHHSTESHVYSVNYATGEKTALVDDNVAAYWSASFSSRGDYYILSYQGPDVPYQEVYGVNSTTEALSVLTSNEALWKNITKLNLPNITYVSICSTSDHPSNTLTSNPSFQILRARASRWFQSQCYAAPATKLQRIC